MLSVVSNAGGLRFQLFVGSFSDRLFIDFLGQLLRDCGRKVHFRLLAETGPAAMPEPVTI